MIGAETAGNELSVVLIALMKGVTEREADAPLWQALLKHEGAVRDHVAVLGLDLRLDEAEGFAYLAQRQQVEGEPELPRLVARRQLSYPVSLLLALLRKKLVEFDATSGERRLIVSRETIVDMLRLFLANTANEARLLDRIDGHIKRVAELGFLRPLRGQTDQFEVSRILKAFVDAQWLNGLAERLAEYRNHAGAPAADAKTADDQD
jgi:uncharacterized protein DUF4194